MDEDTQVVPVDGSSDAVASAAQPESTQTTEAQPVTPQAETPAALSLEQVERLLNEREQKLRAEFDQQARKMQSKTDKAYADAMRKAKVIEESADLLGLDADTIKTAKQALIDKEFAAAFETDKGQAQADAYGQAVLPTPSADTVARVELVDYLKQQGLDENAVDLSKYEGVRRGNVQAEQDFLDDVAIARARQVEQRRQQKQQAAQAKQTAQVKQEFGKVAPPTAGAPSAGYDPIQELEKMNRQGPPDDPMQMNAYLERMKKLQKEAGW